MTDLTRCPCCDFNRVAEGTASADQYQDGLWIGCTACGFSVSGAHHATIRAAWASCCRSRALRDLRLAPVEESFSGTLWLNTTAGEVKVRG